MNTLNLPTKAPPAVKAAPAAKPPPPVKTDSQSTLVQSHLPPPTTKSGSTLVQSQPPASTKTSSQSTLVQSLSPPPTKPVMGNDSVHVQFNPDNRVFWTEHTGLHALSDSELDAAYQRAFKFIKDRVKTLVKEHHWKEIEFGSRLLLLSYQKGYINRLNLPQSFWPFLDVSQFTDYQTQFENVFHARRANSSENDLYIHGPAALADIFYILQCIAPGMLVLTCRSDEEDDIGEKEWVRGLPRDTWIESNAQMLRYILGSKTAYQKLLVASKDPQKAFALEWVVSWSDDDDCRSIGSTVVDDDWDYYNDAQYGWSKIQAIDGTKCSANCGKCPRCIY